MPSHVKQPERIERRSPEAVYAVTCGCVIAGLVIAINVIALARHLDNASGYLAGLGSMAVVWSMVVWLYRRLPG
jgi:uncharacterized BrkB/YihY/UPF0761 family membrane protein